MMNSDQIAVTVPARSEYARTVRLVAGELASRLGMSIDAVDDMKLAAEEAFVLAAGYPGAREVTFDFTLGDDSVEALVGPLAASRTEEAGGEAQERYARFILEAVCDEYEIVDRDGASFVRLVKRTA
jgi:serine/threonine-protein kinase RsbW